jgi:hypothetical protein
MKQIPEFNEKINLKIPVALKTSRNNFPTYNSQKEELTRKINVDEQITSE